MEHEFTKIIKGILNKTLGNLADRAFAESELLQYLNIKTKSASKGSKSRGSFANLYAIYVLVEDYIAKKFHKTGKYSEYQGAVFSKLLKRQRELPFGQKLQNHALNHRLNEEFKKYFPTCDYIPILRSVETNRYWFNENLLKVKIGKTQLNIAEAIIKIIDLDIDKIEKYPITFVIKSSEKVDLLKSRVRKQAERQYSIKAIVERYMQCIEEIINIPILIDRFEAAIAQGHLDGILAEIIRQSKVEFSYEDDYDISDYENSDILV